MNAEYIQNDAAVIIKNIDNNATIPVNGAVSFGFNMACSGSNSVPSNITVHIE
jgi:hypothetical protein